MKTSAVLPKREETSVCCSVTVGGVNGALRSPLLLWEVIGNGIRGEAAGIFTADSVRLESCSARLIKCLYALFPHKNGEEKKSFPNQINFLYSWERLKITKSAFKEHPPLSGSAQARPIDDSGRGWRCLLAPSLERSLPRTARSRRRRREVAGW